MSDSKPQLKQPSKIALLLREKAWTAFCDQADNMDVLLRQLVIVELTLPTLYLGVLKIQQGQDNALIISNLLYAGFFCWLLALIFTLFGLFPYHYKVNFDHIRASDNEDKQAMSIEGFFAQSARIKRRFILLSLLSAGSAIIFTFIDLLG